MSDCTYIDKLRKPKIFDMSIFDRLEAKNA